MPAAKVTDTKDPKIISNSQMLGVYIFETLVSEAEVFIQGFPHNYLSCTVASTPRKPVNESAMEAGPSDREGPSTDRPCGRGALSPSPQQYGSASG